MDFEPHFKNSQKLRSNYHFRDLYFSDERAGKIIGAILNSSLFFFWFITIGNGRNVTGADIEWFPIGGINNDALDQLPDIFDRLMQVYKANSRIRVRKDTELQEFQPGLSKSVIDEIDKILAQYYGLTDEELDYIINYDIKYRLGASVDEED